MSLFVFLFVFFGGFLELDWFCDFNVGVEWVLQVS